MCSLVLSPFISFKGCCFILIELYPVLESLLLELGSPVPLTSSSLSLEAVGLEIGSFGKTYSSLFSCVFVFTALLASGGFWLACSLICSLVLCSIENIFWSVFIIRLWIFSSLLFGVYILPVLGLSPICLEKRSFFAESYRFTSESDGLFVPGGFSPLYLASLFWFYFLPTVT